MVSNSIIVIIVINYLNFAITDIIDNCLHLPNDKVPIIVLTYFKQVLTLLINPY